MVRIMNNHNLFILGPKSIKMNIIEELLTKAQQSISYATLDNIRVTKENRYLATDHTNKLNSQLYIMVDCEFNLTNSILVDENRIGTKFDLPPELFLESSLIGQIIQILARQKITSMLDEPFDIHCGYYDGTYFYDANFGWSIVINNKCYLIPEQIVLLAGDRES